MSNPIDVWLRGPIDGIHPLLQPAAHALLQAQEDVHQLESEVDPSKIWESPSGAACIGFHLRHMSGATDRLFTYARAEQLSENQVAAMKLEKNRGDLDFPALISQWNTTVKSALQQLRTTTAEELTLPRKVGRAQLPSTVIGLLFHAAEHARRHAGQLATTAKWLRL